MNDKERAPVGPECWTCGDSGCSSCDIGLGPSEINGLVLAYGGARTSDLLWAMRHARAKRVAEAANRQLHVSSCCGAGVYLDAVSAGGCQTSCGFGAQYHPPHGEDWLHYWMGVLKRCIGSSHLEANAKSMAQCFSGLAPKCKRKRAAQTEESGHGSKDNREATGETTM